MPLGNKPLAHVLAVILILAGLACYIKTLIDSFYLDPSAVAIAHKNLLSPLQWGLIGFALIVGGLLLFYMARKQR